MILGIEIHIYNQNVGSQLPINFYQINVTKIEIIEKTALTEISINGSL